MSRSQQHIAIISNRGIGDLACTLPLIKLCRQQYPNAHITLFASTINHVLVPFIAEIDQVEILHRRELGKLKAYINMIKLGFKFRKRFDFVIYAQEPRRTTNFFIALLKPKKSLSYVKKNHSARFITDKKHFDRTYKHSISRSLWLLQLLSDDFKDIPDEFNPKLEIPYEIKNKHQQKLDQQLAWVSECNGPLLLISVSSNNKASMLGHAIYAKLLNRLAADHDFKVLVSSLPKDADSAVALSDKLIMPSIAIATPTFEEFMVLLDQVDVCFIGDGGIMHFAAALNKPQLVMFGVTPLEEWKPMSNKAICMHHSTHVNELSQEAIYRNLEALMTRNATFNV